MPALLVSEPQIRPAERRDIEALCHIEHAAFSARLYGGAMMSRRSFLRHLSSPTACLLVADVGGEVRGYALLFLHRGTHHGRFYSLAVHPASQGGGVGRHLFRAIESEAVRRHCHSLLLEIRADNHTLYKRYHALGYREYTRVPHYYADGEAALKMRQPVADIAARLHLPSNETPP